MAGVLAGLAVLALTAAGLAVRSWSRSPDAGAAATEVALRQTAATGGPAGWTVTDPVPILPSTDPAPATRRHGLVVAIDGGDGAETGFTATWTATVSPSSAAASCAALAAWAERVVAAPAETFRSSCRDAVGDSPDSAVFTSHGTSPGPAGRYMVVAMADSDSPSEVVLYATLIFRVSGQ